MTCDVQHLFVCLFTISIRKDNPWTQTAGGGDLGLGAGAGYKGWMGGKKGHI